MTDKITTKEQDFNSLNTEILSEELPTPPKTIESSLMSFIPLLLIFFVFYFLMIRPQENKRKSLDQLLKTLKKGEIVVTNGGIFGTVMKVNDEVGEVELEIANHVIIKILRSAIIDIVSRKSEK